MEVNVLEHINTDGSFKDSLYENIPAICGEEFKDSKIFKRAGNLATLFKNTANTKKALDTKMEGVIKKPAEDASDEEKANFKASIYKMMGAPDNVDGYEIPAIEGMPENIKLSDEAVKGYREICLRHGISTEAFKELAEYNGKAAMNSVANAQKAIDDKFNADSTELKNDWKGDNLIANARIAYNAMNQFMKIRKNEDFLKILKESKIYDSAGDLDKWRELDVMPRDLALWHAIGVAMKSPDVSDEGDSRKVPDTTPEKVYDHPTSQRLFVSK